MPPASALLTCARRLRRVFAGPAALAALAAPPALADDYDGRYKLTRDADCAAPLGAEGFLRIEDGVFRGAESQCSMTNPIDVRGMEATLYDMLCTGDGLTWSERAIVMRGAEGDLVLVWDGYAFSYPACPKPTMRPRPRPERLAER